MSTSNNSALITKIYNSRNIILQLLKDRGYNTNDYEGFSINEVHIMYTNKQLDLLLVNNFTKRKVYVSYHLARKLGAIHIHELADDLYNMEEILTPEDDLIIVTKDKPNDTIIKLLRSLYNREKQYINVYNIHNYLFNILEHSLVPLHKVLTEDEEKGMRKQYNIIENSQIPEISRFDPVAVAIGLRPNQVCKITRQSATAINTPYFRFCKS